MVTTEINFVEPDKTKVFGLDISHWAGSAVDFSVAKRNGLDFAFIKAKDGLWTSRWFVENWKGTKDNGIPRGGYHWLYPNSTVSVRRQVENLYWLLSGESGELPEKDFGELPVVVDFETTSSGNPTYSDLKLFLLEWESRTGTKPIIYTSSGFWKSSGDSTDPFWKQYKLWVANYGVTVPRLPVAWDKYTFWQWTESGRGTDYGVNPLYKKAVDLNYYWGSAEDFNSEFGIQTGTNTEPPAPPSDEEKTGFVIVPTLNVRESNSVSSPLAGTLSAGEKVVGIDAPQSDGYSWIKISEPTKYIGKYCATQSSTSKYVEFGALSQVERHMVLKDGTLYHKVFRFDNWCNVLVINPTGKDIKIRKFDGLKTVSEVAEATGATYVSNGGDFNAYGAVGLAIADGSLFGLQREYEPFFNASKENVVSVLPHTEWRNGYNAVAGKRFIVVDGKVSPNISDSWYAEHPRTLAGVREDGKFVLCTVDGRQPNQNGYSAGVDLFEAAEIMIEFGCKTATDLDGGGSTALSVAELGGIVNVPINSGVMGNERAVATHVLVYVNSLDGNNGGGTTMPQIGEKYKVLLDVRKRYLPNFFAGYETADPNALEGEIITVVEFTERSEDELGNPKPAGGTIFPVPWIKGEDGRWVPMSHFKEDITYLIKVEDAPTTPPPPPVPTEKEIAYAVLIATDGSEIKRLYPQP